MEQMQNLDTQSFFQDFDEIYALILSRFTWKKIPPTAVGIISKFFSKLLYVQRFSTEVNGTTLM